MISPLRTDGWSPADYRAALAANGNQATQRRAEPSRPRHAALAGQLKALLKWRAMRSLGEPGGTNWLADNDNLAPEDWAGQSLDRHLQVRPTPDEMEEEWTKGATAWAVTTGPAFAARDSTGERAPKVTRRVVARYGGALDEDGKLVAGIEFSNGQQEEPCLSLDPAGKFVHSSVRMPTGSIVRFNNWRPSERWVAPGRRPQDAPAPTVKVGGHQSGSVAFDDHVADLDEFAHVLRRLDPAAVAVLDCAIEAANFREIGETLGKSGKHAERTGKLAVIEACKKLDDALTG